MKRISIRAQSSQDRQAGRGRIKVLSQSTSIVTCEFWTILSQVDPDRTKKRKEVALTSFQIVGESMKTITSEPVLCYRQASLHWLFHFFPVPTIFPSFPGPKSFLLFFPVPTCFPFFSCVFSQSRLFFPFSPSIFSLFSRSLLFLSSYDASFTNIRWDFILTNLQMNHNQSFIKFVYYKTSQIFCEALLQSTYQTRHI